MSRRARIYQPAQGTCPHCRNFFVYFQLTKRKKFCSAECARQAGNRYFNALTSQARKEARMQNA